MYAHCSGGLRPPKKLWFPGRLRRSATAETHRIPTKLEAMYGLVQATLIERRYNVRADSGGESV